MKEFKSAGSMNGQFVLSGLKTGGPNAERKQQLGTKRVFIYIQLGAEGVHKGK